MTPPTPPSEGSGERERAIEACAMEIDDLIGTSPIPQSAIAAILRKHFAGRVDRADYRQLPIIDCKQTHIRCLDDSRYDIWSKPLGEGGEWLGKDGKWHTTNELPPNYWPTRAAAEQFLQSLKE